MQSCNNSVVITVASVVSISLLPPQILNAELSSKQYKLHGTDKVTKWRVDLQIGGSVRKGQRLDKISNRSVCVCLFVC